MSAYNRTAFHPSVFVLAGFPGLEEYYLHFSILFCVLYLLAVTCNLALLCIIKADHNLHEPMYIFLSILATVDLVLSSTTFPKLLAILWFGDSTITFEGCFVQMSFAHFFTAMESTILVVMAFDRYVAICKPLHYTAIFTNSFIVKLGTVSVLRSAVLSLPQYMYSSQLSFCSSNVIPHYYCDHTTTLSIACADITINKIFGILLTMLISGADITLIFFSYLLILRAVFKLGSARARWKTFSTCVSHFCVILYFYTAVLFSIFTKRFGNIPSEYNILVASSYVLIPPALNPIIYGIRTKEIRQAFLRHMNSRARVSSVIPNPSSTT
ncbi:olfactory receptor 52E4-like [Latimeria chalumnae]|uniref:olfactory receptor 52E4-like n=1 Tax=Latimeria chalumnae TaxID=7897 RepID=UPI00313D1019